MNHKNSRSASYAAADADITADEEKIINGWKPAEGDVLIGLASSGVHTNGFAPAHKVFAAENCDMNAPLSELGGKSLGQVLLEPTRIYAKAVNTLLKESVEIHAISHITDSFYKNVPQMMGEGLTAQIILHRLPHLPIFDLIQKAGSIPARDMYSTFNMGIGMILAVPAPQAHRALTILRSAGEDACRIGTVVHGDEGVLLV